MDTELAAVPLVAVGDRESHHADAGFEVRHAAGDPMIDGAGTHVEASGDLPLAHPRTRRPLADQSRISGQGGAHRLQHLAKADGDEGRFECLGAFHGMRARGH